MLHVRKIWCVGLKELPVLVATNRCRPSEILLKTTCLVAIITAADDLTSNKMWWKMSHGPLRISSGVTCTSLECGVSSEKVHHLLHRSA